MKILSVKLEKPIQLTQGEVNKESWTAAEADIAVSGEWVIVRSKRDGRSFAIHGSKAVLAIDPEDARDIFLEQETAPAPKRKAG